MLVQMRNNPASLIKEMEELMNTSNYSNNVSPSVNIKERENAFDMAILMPGYSKEEVKISLKNKVLSVSASKEVEVKDENAEAENKNEDKYKQLVSEFETKSYKRIFTLSDTIDQEGLKASMENGILTIELPKKEEVIIEKSIEIK